MRDRTGIIIGIPSLNEADNIAFVANQVAIGLKRYYPTHPAVIVNADNNSKDGTKDAFLNSDTLGIPKRYISTGEGIVGKGNNMKNLFIEVERLNAKVVIVVDADLKSISPEWVKTLATPIFGGYDYATPLYSRNEYDGTITNHICYPLIYGLFKSNIRQPIGGDFSFSSRMAKYWLNREWLQETQHYGIDIFMTASTLLNGFNVCQVVLGSKVHKPSAPKLGPMFTQVVTTLFNKISRFKDLWINDKLSKDCPVLGHFDFQDPQALSIDYKGMKKASFEGFTQKERALSQILPSRHYQSLKKMYKEMKWTIGSELWAKILYDFIYAYDVSEDKKEVVEALKPLYFARAASFYRRTMDMSHKEAEEKIIKQAKQFKRCKRYLVRRFLEREAFPSIGNNNYLNKFASHQY